MDKMAKQKIFQRRHTDGKEACEKNINNYQ